MPDYIIEMPPCDGSRRQQITATRYSQEYSGDLVFQWEHYHSDGTPFQEDFLRIPMTRVCGVWRKDYSHVIQDLQPGGAPRMNLRQAVAGVEAPQPIAGGSHDRWIVGGALVLALILVLLVWLWVKRTSPE